MKITDREYLIAQHAEHDAYTSCILNVLRMKRIRHASILLPAFVKFCDVLGRDYAADVAVRLATATTPEERHALGAWLTQESSSLMASARDMKAGF